MNNKFFGGVHPAEHKDLTERKAAIPLAEAPAQVVIPMSMHVGAPCKPVVAVGDQVKVGQVIGETTGLGAPIHASVSGTVSAVEVRPTAMSSCMSVVIDNDFKDTLDPSVQARDNVAALTGSEIIEIVKNAGITGMGGASFPTHVKLSGAVGKADTLILNGSECEPYITADHRIMLERGEAIIGGAKLMAKALGLDEAIIGIEDNKPDAVANLKAIAEAEGGVRVEALKTRYPQGAEKQLIQRLTGRQIPPGKLPADVKCLVCNVATAAAVYDAVTAGKPLTHRYVTVTGGALNEPMNVIAPVGTPVYHLIKLAGGFKTDPDRVIMGGTMMGNSIYDLDAPVQKASNCVLCMTPAEVGATDPAQTCIRCGKCVEVCPMHLTPVFMRQNATKERWDAVAQLNVMDCIECGCCSYICPARIPLVQTFRVAKGIIRTKAAQAKLAKEGGKV